MENLENVIIELHKISITAKEEGFLAFDGFSEEYFKLLPEEIHFFGSTLLDIMIYGEPDEAVRELGKAYISQSSLKGNDRLCLMLILEGLLLIRRHSNESFSEYMFKKLLFLTGYENSKKLSQSLFFEDIKICEPYFKSQVRLGEKENKKPACMVSFGDILKLDDDTLRNVFSSFTVNEIAFVLKICTHDDAARIFSVFPELISSTIKHQMEMTGPVRIKDCQLAQKEMCRKIEALLK